MKFEAWQLNVVDGQLGQGIVRQVVPSPRFKVADRERLMTLSWTSTYNVQMIVSGKVSRVSEGPVIEGSRLLFYVGELTTDGERVRCFSCLMPDLKLTLARLHSVVCAINPQILRRQVQ